MSLLSMPKPPEIRNARLVQMMDPLQRGPHLKTHCKRGHELSGENLRVSGRYRKCKACEAFRRGCGPKKP